MNLEMLWGTAKALIFVYYSHIALPPLKYSKHKPLPKLLLPLSTLLWSEEGSIKGQYSWGT